MGLFSKIKDTVDETVAKLQRDAESKKWLDAIDDAMKREKAWRTKAAPVVDLFEQEKSTAENGGDVADFNILYANTETLSPAVYNNTPRPVVKRKIDKENPLGIAAAAVLQKTLAYLVDTADANYTPFDDLMKTAVQEALVPGRGLCRFSFDSNEKGYKQTVCGDEVAWNRVVYGYAKQWADVPWLAYEHFMTREEAIANLGEEVGKKITLTHSPATESDKDGEDSMPANAQGAKFAHVWEVWDKAKREVVFVSDGWPKVCVKRPDPLGLEGFFNSPRPIQFIKRIKSLVPNTLYLLYETQAKELDDVTRRIGKLVNAMKIRGFYDSTLEGLDQLMLKPENTLLPAQNVAAMLQGQTLEKAIWLMPIEKLVAVLQQLYLNRQQIISVIHQITGIADIMRGASQASETLGAQEIKQAWGTMRLKRMQKETHRFARDCFRMQAEIAAKKFSVETFAQMTGLKFPRKAEQQQAQLVLQQAQQMGPMLQQQVQQGLMAPEQAQAQGQMLQQKAQEAQQVLGKPAWEDIVEFLKQDTIRNFAIDIETNSTLDIEATEDKAELAEMMNSMSQLMNGVYPMVEQGVLPFEAAKSLMLTVIQKFRLGEEVEETFRAMQQPQPKPDPAQMKVEAEMKRDQQKFEQEQQLTQQEQANKQAEVQLERERLAMEKEKMAMELEAARAEHTLAMQKLQAETAAAIAIKQTPEAAPLQPEKPSPDAERTAGAMEGLTGAMSKRKRRVPKYDQEGNITEVTEEDAE
jgi:L-rhamnose mutarotase